MDFLKKVKGSAVTLAKQGIQLVKTAAAGEATANSPQVVPPHREVVLLFKNICSVMDLLSIDAEAQSPLGEKKLNESKIRGQFRSMLEHLQKDADIWVSQQGKAVFGDNVHTDDISSLDALLQYQMIQEWCKRGILDLPRGCLPLVMNIITQLISFVNYPLLPEQSVHKPVAQLVAVAARFDAIFAPVGKNATPQAVQEYYGYRKRVGR
jgi:hypothetical protein